LRYFWQGDFIDPMPVWRGNGNGLAKILGDIRFVTAPDSPFEIDGKPVTQVQYLGYRLRKGAPEFHYALNGVRFREWIQPLPDDEGIRLIFETDGDLARRWTREHGIATIPMGSFGDSWEPAVRLCFAKEDATLDRAVELLRAIPSERNLAGMTTRGMTTHSWRTRLSGTPRIPTWENSMCSRFKQI